MTRIEGWEEEEEEEEEECLIDNDEEMPMENRLCLTNYIDVRYFNIAFPMMGICFIKIQWVKYGKNMWIVYITNNIRLVLWVVQLCHNLQFVKHLTTDVKSHFKRKSDMPRSVFD